MELLIWVLLFSSPWQPSHCLDLSYNNLAFVPPNIPRNETDINLSHNLITTIGAGNFSGFNDLKKIDMRTNSLTSIDTKAFINSTIKEICLDDNKFEEFPYFEQRTLNNLQASFNDIMNFDLFWFLTNNPYVTNLEIRENRLQSVHVNQSYESASLVDSIKSQAILVYLHMGGNQINYLEPGIFNGFKKLTYLILSNNLLNISIGCDYINDTNISSYTLSENQITSIPDLHCVAQTLRELILRDNRISVLSSTSIEQLPYLEDLDLSRNVYHLPAWTQSSSLSLKLSGNPLKCDCRWEWLFSPSEAWREIRERMVPAEEVACLGGPHFLSLMPWANLTQSEICPRNDNLKRLSS
ncbi:hypothetical protein CAPTEDRAFT_194317 [Capitella teleta]|uniref:LRRCT domain-containing protein n=1 Tax=Capitella teleta TaxID=283909 RepID=R7U831_CAPTE|nr:hypothetical protein CAPTEDRAFT_194317 [Capitella teleta]|eukprot:ELU02525.1 hypothetical protein CAPTEDRAFT_194317 [Capitella teleta]